MRSVVQCGLARAAWVIVMREAAARVRDLPAVLRYVLATARDEPHELGLVDTPIRVIVDDLVAQDLEAVAERLRELAGLDAAVAVVEEELDDNEASALEARRDLRQARVG